MFKDEFGDIWPDEETYQQHLRMVAINTKNSRIGAAKFFKAEKEKKLRWEKRLKLLS